MKEKIVCFAGHRYDFQNIRIKDKLKEEIIKLINKGCTIFFDGGKGFFDKLSASIVIELKKQYPQIKIYRILTYYHHNKDKWELPLCYDGSIMPDIEEYHPKIKITKKNE